MNTRVLCLALVLVCGCGGDREEPAIKPFDGTVTFFIEQDGGLTAQTTTSFAVNKADRKAIVNAWQQDAPEGTVYGRHNFPAGTEAEAVAAYYGGLLRNAGWKTPTDYHVAGASIHFFEITSLLAGANRAELQVTVAP